MPTRKSDQMRKTKFDLYFEICQRLVTALSNIDSARLSTIVDSYSNAVDQISEWVSEEKNPVPKSEIAKGLEQGVNDLPLLIDDLEPPIRSAALAAYWDTLDSVIPDYAERLAKNIQRILKRGYIKSESEFYLLHNRLDQIEGSGSEEELVIDQLLTQYETEA